MPIYIGCICVNWSEVKDKETISADLPSTLVDWPIQAKQVKITAIVTTAIFVNPIIVMSLFDEIISD